MEQIKTITVFAKEVKNEKQKFIACTANIANKWYKIKFTKASGIEVKENGLYEVVVDIDDCSLERGKEIENKKGKMVKQNDTLWINKVMDINHYTEEQMKERNRTTMASVFGE